MRYIYTFFLYLILPFLPFRLLWRSRKNGAYRQRILERFGYYKSLSLKESIWVHAVSVGETIAAVPLVKSLSEHYPDITIVMTTMTPTGAEQVRKNFNNKVLHLYVPYDYPEAIKKFLSHVKPKILILMETELWPNILHYLAKYRIPVVLGNARLSVKSFAGYNKLHTFFKRVLACITMIMAQSYGDKERFLTLGTNPEKLSVAGNVKFDLMIPEEVLSRANKFRSFLGETRYVWVAASTHENEEEKILVAAKKILEILPETLLILVPRHPERFTQVFELCQQKRFSVLRYSNIQDYSPATNVILGDVMGQLPFFYAASDIAFVGGSLVPWGGHNLLEPAALAKPVISGPYLHAFLEISQLFLEAKALIKVSDEVELIQSLLKLFSNQALRKKLGAAALDVVEKHRGATKKILAVVENVIS